MQFNKSRISKVISISQVSQTKSGKCEHFYHPPTKLREGNVFNHFHLFTGGANVSITHDTLDLTVQCHPQSKAPPPASDNWWPSLETCSNLFTWETPSPTTTDIWWPKHVWLASRWYVSYWNAFLFNAARTLQKVLIFLLAWTEQKLSKLIFNTGNKLSVVNYIWKVLEKGDE